MGPSDHGIDHPNVARRLVQGASSTGSSKRSCRQAGTRWQRAAEIKALPELRRTLARPGDAWHACMRASLVHAPSLVVCCAILLLLIPTSWRQSWRRGSGSGQWPGAHGER
eukprot:scaffold26383_cov99-Isochrysis_galbana.AAC.4